MRKCVDCGDKFGERTGKGRPFTRCEACRTSHRPKSRAQQAKKSACRDCGTPITAERAEDTVHLRVPTRCDLCRKRSNYERQLRWREAHPEKWKAAQGRHNSKRLADPEFRRKKREAAILRTYGIAADEWAKRMAAQGGVCAICGKPPRGRPNGGARDDLPAAAFHVDHDHVTGRVRGLLCGNCNTALGLFGDDVETLLAAAEYLRK